MNDRVAVVILNYKNWQDTIECFQSLLEITYIPIRIILVDNDSQDNSITHIMSWIKSNSLDFLFLDQDQSENGHFVDSPFVLIQAKSNKGYATGNNIGIRWAIRSHDEYVLILNNDTLVKKEFLDPLVHFLETHNTVAMVGPKIVYPDGSIDRNCARKRPLISDYFFRIGLFGKLFPNNYWCRNHYYSDEYTYQASREVDIISGACMLMRTKIIQCAGLLDERTFLYWEEFILYEKFQSLNKTTYIVPNSIIIHKGGQSIKRTQSLFGLEKRIESCHTYLRFYRGYPAWFTQVLMLNQRFVYWLLKLKNISLIKR